MRPIQSSALAQPNQHVRNGCFKYVGGNVGSHCLASLLELLTPYIITVQLTICTTLYASMTRLRLKGFLSAIYLGNATQMLQTYNPINPNMAPGSDMKGQSQTLGSETKNKQYIFCEVAWNTTSATILGHFALALWNIVELYVIYNSFCIFEK